MIAGLFIGLALGGVGFLWGWMANRCIQATRAEAVREYAESMEPGEHADPAYMLAQSYFIVGYMAGGIHGAIGRLGRETAETAGIRFKGNG